MMSFNSTGIYTPAAGALTAAPGGIIKSSVWNAIFTDMTAAFTQVAQSRFLLNTLTAAASATLGDTTSLTSTFKDYEIVFENLVPGTTTVTLEFQVHSGGSFQATSYLSSTFGTNGTATILANAATTFIPLTHTTVTTGNNGVSGTIRIYGPVNGATLAKSVTGNTTASNGAVLATVVAGFWNNTAALDGFQILFSSGNIASGTVKIYGLL